MVRVSEDIFVNYSCLEPSNSFSSLQSKVQALTKCYMIFPPLNPCNKTSLAPLSAHPHLAHQAPDNPALCDSQNHQTCSCLRDDNLLAATPPMWALSLLPHLRRSFSNVTSITPSLITIFKTKHPSIPFPSYFVALFSSIKITIQCTMFCLIFLLSQFHLESKLHEDKDFFLLNVLTTVSPVPRKMMLLKTKNKKTKTQ